MKRSIIFTIIFLFTMFIFLTCLSNFFLSFYYTVKEGDNYYHSKVVENVHIFNYGKNIKSVKYCFTKEDTCSDYLDYEGDLSSRMINVSIDYPDSSEPVGICVKVTSTTKSSIHCSKEKYVVDSLKPVIKPLYGEMILSDMDDGLENLFEVKSNTGVKSFNCKYKVRSRVIDCKAIGNNNLEASYTKSVYINSDIKLEDKDILFVGDDFTRAKNDDYYGFAGRIGFGNYMNWSNAGRSGATVAKTSRKHIKDQILDNKDNNYDYVILQGGINDMKKNVLLGEVSDSFEVEDFNSSTFAGGLEELIYYTKKYNKDAKIGYIIPYQTPNSDWGENITDRSLQVELIKKICDKWEVPYLDLYDGLVYEEGKIKTYSEILKVDTGENFYKEKKTEVLLNTNGYNTISKYIGIWIKTI